MQLKTHNRKPFRNLVAGLLLAPLLVIGTLSLSTNVMAESDTATPEPDSNVIKRVAPKYPTAAAKNGIEGRVKMQITINAEGQVENIEVVESHPAGVFDKVAMEAMSQWVFKPIFIDGEPATAEFLQTLVFAMPKQPDQ